MCDLKALTPTLAIAIAVTAGISVTKEDSSAVHWCERGGGLLSLVNTCGEIGVCTPCTEATPSAEGEYPLWVGSGGPPAKGGLGGGRMMKISSEYDKSTP